MEEESIVVRDLSSFKMAGVMLLINGLILIKKKKVFGQLLFGMCGFGNLSLMGY